VYLIKYVHIRLSRLAEPLEHQRSPDHRRSIQGQLALELSLSAHTVHLPQIVSPGPRADYESGMTLLPPGASHRFEVRVGCSCAGRFQAVPFELEVVASFVGGE